MATNLKRGRVHKLVGGGVLLWPLDENKEEGELGDSYKEVHWREGKAEDPGRQRKKVREERDGEVAIGGKKKQKKGTKREDEFLFTWPKKKNQEGLTIA